MGFVALIPEPAATQHGGFQRIYPAAVTGLRLAADGQVSIWASLPADTMSAVIHAEDLTNQIADLLRMIGSLDVVNSDTVAVAVGIDNVGMISEGRVTDLPRSQSSPLSMSDKPVRLPPDELVSIAALSAGAVEAAKPLAEALADAATRRR
ncbi:MAG: hypothetical protein DLM57_13880 [Pseudonocardiales bacterium]|nr:MAG: hypothetical protein DLM57_13880 [Pseudonocardiales bacterium]